MTGIVVLALGLGGWWVWGRSLGCGWPMRLSGDAGRGPVGAVNCYLRYEAEDDKAGLATLMPIPPWGPHYRVTDADLRYSTDARKGVATVRLTVNAVAPQLVFVKIKYGDGVVENTIAESEVVFEQNNLAWKVQMPENN